MGHAEKVLAKRRLRPFRVAALALFAAALALAAPVAAGQSQDGGEHAFSVLTQNAYVGADIERVMLLDPSDPEYFTQLVQTVTTTYYEMLASEPEARMAGIADRIAERLPDVVALQEVYGLRLQSPGDLVEGGQIPATQVVVDFLRSLQAELAARGLSYTVAAETTETDVELPMFNLQTGGFDDARLTDRDVILIRADLPPGHLRMSNPQSGNFANHIVIPAIGLSVLRGWCAVDLFVRGNKFRFINAHLEVETQPDLQWLQAQELLDGPANSRLPVVLAGDFNADANGGTNTWTYDGLLSAGFIDAWAELGAGEPGLTWGHDPYLADAAWPLSWRIDLVLHRNAPFVPRNIEVVDTGLARTLPPFWPSDHAAVAAEFRLQ